MWNKPFVLTITLLVTLVITAVSLLLTEGTIYFCFKSRNKKHKLKIQNTIKFKTLNVTFGLGLIMAALFHLIKIHLDILDTYLAHFSTSIVLNSVLAAFIFANKDTLEFINRKMKVLRDQYMFAQCMWWNTCLRLNQSEFNGVRLEPLDEIGPWMMPKQRKENMVHLGNGQHQSRRPRRSSLFVIDVD